ncbi:MAG: MFS transporter [Clostridia bacterium]|nr:MFS transporter [Clostridia bacterium]
MKLNYKRTVFVGMAFFLILAFWQAYDAIIPLILTNHFGLPQSASGVIMSIDNVLAVFMLPLFGSLSDKVKSRFGRRTPFIFFGTIAAIVAFIALTFIDNYQLARVVAEGIPSVQQGLLSEEAYSELIRELTMKLTTENPWPLIGFIGTLLVVLIAMATFRSPAVALMPDITVKPLRSKGNAIINLVGTAGAIAVLVLGMVFGTSKNHYMPYTPYVIAVTSIMLIGLVLFLVFVKEKQWAQEMEEETERLGLEDQPEESESKQGSRKLSKGEFASLLLILASVALWYVGYNSITSKYSVYATNILGFDFNLTLIIAQAAAIVSYIPLGMLSSKFGRRKTILVGVVMLATAFFCGIFVTPSTPEFIMYPIFVLAGIAWATINVNSFPMVVELASGSDVGKYTGYYYTASMAAQILAPILSGFLYDALGMRYTFFAFGTVFVVFSFVTMFFVKHGDAKPVAKKSVLEHLDVD